jgi:hypothetical protein
LRTLDRGCTFFPWAVSPDGRLAIAQAWADLSTMQINVYDIATGKVVNVLHKKDGWWGPVAFSADSKRALIGTLLGKVTLCEIETGREVWSFKGGVGDFLAGERSALISYGYAGSKWHIVNAETGTLERTITVDFGELDGVDGEKVRLSTRAAMSADGKVCLMVAGENNDPLAGNRITGPIRRPSNLTAKAWDIGVTPPRLVKSWADPTAPDEK